MAYRSELEARLAKKTIEFFRSREIARARHFDGNHAIEFWITRLVDGAEASLANRIDHLEATQFAVFRRVPVDGRSDDFQSKAGAAGRAGDVRVRSCRHHFDRILAMGADDVHRASLHNDAAWMLQGDR